LDVFGNQKKMNYALNQPSKEAFIAAVTDGLTPPPGYFGMNVAMNKKGYLSFDEVLAKGLQALDADALEALVNNEDALVLDVRSAADFAKGFIPRSVNIGLKGDFAPWVGAVIMDVNQPLVLVCNEGDEEETITRLSRVGFDKVLGYLKGGIQTWIQANKEIDTVDRIDAEEFASIYNAENTEVIDVRKEGEYDAEHVVHAHSRPLAYINEWFSSLGKEPFLLHCQGGYRSMIAASILKSRGIHNFKEVDGGYKAISATSVAKTSEQKVQA
jgi:hydroxyacylglutathione hydrolase